MTFVTALFEKLTAGELAFLSVSYIFIAALAVLSTWPIAFLKGSNYLEKWRARSRTVVIVAPDLNDPKTPVYHDLGEGMRYDTEIPNMPRSGYITTLDRVPTRVRRASTAEGLAFDNLP